MAFSGGVYSRLYNWVNEGAAQPVEIAKLDAEVAGIADGLSGCILRDGTGIPTADTPWNSKKITGLATPTSSTDAATKAYVDSLIVSPETGASILAKLITVDGSGSLLDADLLDGLSSAYFLSASNITTGTLPDSQFPATLPAASGANLTALNATQLTSGTVPSARITSIDAACTVNSETVGYRKIPKSATTSGSIPATEVGKMIPCSAGVTIPNSTFAAGDAVSFTNSTGSPITITASVGTLYWTATGGTGNRTLAGRGQCTVWFESSTVAYISGSGLT